MLCFLRELNAVTMRFRVNLGLDLGRCTGWQRHKEPAGYAGAFGFRRTGVTDAALVNLRRMRKAPAFLFTVELLKEFAAGAGVAHGDYAGLIAL